MKWRTVETLVEDPNPNAPRHAGLYLLVVIPEHYGKPTDDLKAAQEAKRILQTGLHSRVRVGLMNDVPDREYARIV